MSGKLRVLANLRGITPGKTLGVGHFTFSLLRALRDLETDIRIVVSPAQKAAYDELPGIADEIALVPPDAAALQDFDLEYLPHQFQTGLSPLPRVATCFDLHLFDVPWKYSPRETYVRLFENALLPAEALLFPFLRPFERIGDMLPVHPPKHFIHCPTLLGDTPLREEDLARARRGHASYVDRPFLLYPSQLQAHKNHARLLEALAVLRRGGTDAALICPGSDFDATLRRQLTGRARELDLEDAVCFTGPIDNGELRALYHLCTAAVSPSLIEGGNMIAQEALHFRKPVACADTEASRIQNRLMEAAIPLFSPEDPEDMARCLLRLLREGPDLVEANAGATEIVRSWTWEKTARACAEVFRRTVRRCKETAGK